MTGRFGDGPLRVEVVADGLGFVEGPAVLPDGRIALVSMSRGSVLILDPDGTVAAEHRTGGGPNGLAVGADGALYVAQNGGRFAARSTAAPGIQVIRDGHIDYAFRGLESPNDLVFGPDGRLWVTDSRADADFRHPETTSPGQVWAIDIDTGRPELMAQGPVFVNGIGFSPGRHTLYVTETAHAHVTAYPPRRRCPRTRPNPRHPPDGAPGRTRHRPHGPPVDRHHHRRPHRRPHPRGHPPDPAPPPTTQHADQCLPRPRPSAVRHRRGHRQLAPTHPRVTPGTASGRPHPDRALSVVDHAVGHQDQAESWMVRSSM